MAPMRTESPRGVVHEIVIRPQDFPSGYQVDCLGCKWRMLTARGIEHANLRAEVHLRIVSARRRGEAVKNICGMCGHPGKGPAGEPQHLGLLVCTECECDTFEAWEGPKPH